MDIIRNSALVRFIVWLYAFFRNAYQYSLLGKIAGGWYDSYEKSSIKKLWAEFFGRPNAADFSLYAKFLSAVERFLIFMGKALENSVFYRALMAVRSLYFKLTESSLVFSYINRVPLRRWFLVVFAFYLPIEYALRDVLHIGFLASIWEELLILIAAGLVLWRSALRLNKGAFKRGTALETMILLYILICFLLMLINRPYPQVVMAGFRAQVEYVVWFCLLVRLVEDDSDAKTVVWTFMGVVTLLALHGIYQYIIGVSIPASWVSQTEMGVRTRVFSITGSPNIFGDLLVIAAPSCAALMYYCKDGWKKFLALCGTGVMCLSILFTFSRGAWVGLIVAIIIFALYVDRRLFAIMGMAMAGALIAIPSIANRITYLFTSDYAEASAVGGRALRWETGWKLLHDNSPWLGYGLGRFGGAVAMNNQILDKTEEFSYFYMDNYYLKTLVETGYIGLIVYILVIISFVILALTAVYRTGRGHSFARTEDALTRNIGNDKLICVGLFAGMAGCLVHCYFENIFEEPYMMSYFWGLAGVLAYYAYYSKKGRVKRES